MTVDLIYRVSTKELALRQGEILTGVVQYKPKVDSIITPESSSIPFEAIIHPYAIIVAYVCDRFLHIKLYQFKRSLLPIPLDYIYKAWLALITFPKDRVTIAEF